MEMGQLGSLLRDGLTLSLEMERDSGLPRVPVEGKLLRPMVALLCVPPDRREELDGRFWSGALAIQMVHEASLLHDDILDDATERRGRSTMVASDGTARALVEGDHLLTAAYRVAAETGSLEFATTFARGVERTVHGEKLQHVRAGRPLTEAEYLEVVDGKSGELFGCAAALWSHLSGDGSPTEVRSLGVRIGRLYQRVDDFLDYCPRANAGKAPHQDYRQRKWTWVLGHGGPSDFDLPTDSVTDAMFTPTPGGESPMRQALAALDFEAQELCSDLEAAMGGRPGLVELVREWTGLARRALEKEEAALQTVPVEAGEDDWLPFFARNSRTFRFASRLFPPEEEALIAGVYAFCRFTDDMVDGREDLPAYQLSARLDGWRHLMSRAYHHGDSGVTLLDRVLGETAARGVPLDHAMALVDGVEMDVTPRVYGSLNELLGYTYRVASVVGLWVTELFGIRDLYMLQRAEALGHAMQLTNILRDVGEDWRMGRLYLPRDRMAAHGVGLESLAAMVEGRTAPTEGYRDLLEELMGEADRRYDLAMEAVPHLPGYFGRPVAVAARVYQGIHARIRANGHDNLTLRAHTRLRHKLILGGRALWEIRSRRARRRPDLFAVGASSAARALGAVDDSNRMGAPVP